MVSAFMSHSPQIIAHRGASFDAPENTLASIKLGWAQRADAVEVDIHLTHDDEVVLLHDRTLQRTTGHPGGVAALDWAMIRTLDAGSWKGRAFVGEKVPSLAEALAVIPQAKGIVIEIKDTGQSIVTALKRVLESSSISWGQVVLIAFDYETLKAAKAALPEATTLYLASGINETGQPRTITDLDALITQAVAAGFDGLNLDHDWPIDAALVQRVHGAELKLYVWTINDIERARYLMETGVDGISTDRPGWIRANLLQEAAST